MFTWNSGSWASRTFRASGRNLPIRVPVGHAFDFAGLVAGLGDKAFGDEILWITPRRAFIGARLKF